MTQQDILGLIQEALSRGSLDDLQQAYMLGQRSLPEMPKVHDSYALILSNNDYKQEAYSAIQSVISENKNRHARMQGAESSYDYGLSHYNAFEITEGEAWLAPGERAYHAANALWYLQIAEHKLLGRQKILRLLIDCLVNQ